MIAGKIVYVFAGVITLLLGMLAFDAITNRGPDREEWRKSLDSLAVRIADLSVRTATVDTLYLGTVREFRTTVQNARDKIKTLPDTGWRKIVAKMVDSIEAKCDLTFQSCERRVANRDSIIGSMRQQIDLLENPPRQPRFEYFVASGYDILAAAPYARAGTDMRLLGPLRAASIVEYQLEWKRPRIGVELRLKF